MTRSMADSVTATDIPPGRFDLVAGYVDGLYRWTDQDWLFHHQSKLVTIAVSAATNDGDVLDVETGDATPEQVVPWIRMRRAAGMYPGTIYIEASRADEVAAALVPAGLGDVRLWIAEWNGIPHMHPNAVATQWANPAYGSGGHFDVSQVADYWPGIDTVAGLVQVPDYAAVQGLLAQGVPVYYLDPVGKAQVFSPTLNLPPGTPLYRQPAPVSPPPSNPPADSIPPFQTSPPPVASDIDQTRTAWSNLAAFLTQDLPAFVAELLRLLGLYRKAP